MRFRSAACLATIVGLLVAGSAAISIPSAGTGAALQSAWVHQLELSSQGTFGETVAVDPAGDSFVAGGFTAVGVPGVFQSDFIAKRDAAGTLQWVRHLDVNHGCCGHYVSVATDSQGNAFVASETDATLPGSSDPLQGICDAYIAKYSPAGALLWLHQYGMANHASWAAGLAVNASDDVYVAAVALHNSFPEDYEATVLKYTPAGTVVWQHPVPKGVNGFPSVVTDSYEGYGLAVDKSDDYFLAGRTASPSGAQLDKFSPDGALLWANMPVAGELTSAIVDEDGSVIVAGSGVGGGSFTGRYSSDGTEFWSQTIPCCSEAFNVGVDASGNIFSAGFEWSSEPEDAFITMYGPAGNLQTLKVFGSPARDEAFGLAIDAAGSIYVSGSTYGTLPGSSEQLAQYADAFLSKWTVQSVPLLDQVALTATPSTQTVGKAVTLTATLRTGSGAPVSNALVSFAVAGGPDAGHFAAVIRTNANGVATTTLKSSAVGTDSVEAWVDSNINGTVDTGETVGTTTEKWLPMPVTLLFIQGISSSSTCAGDSPDFVGHLNWYRSSLNALVGAGSKYIYYGYRSPHTAQPLCAPTASHVAYPQYSKPDACWSIDDAYTDVVTVKPVPGGGEATRLANFLKSYLDAHPSETISIVAHSQGGVLAAYTVKQKLNTPTLSKYLKRIRAIVTLDSPLGGINGIAPAILSRLSACPIVNRTFDSPYDMSPRSAVIDRITDSSKPSSVKLFTVDAVPGTVFGVVNAIDDAHSTTWWAAAHIQIGSPTHSDIWSDDDLTPTATKRLVRFTACAIDNLAADCTAYAKM